MPDRFDLENDILAFLALSEDLDAIAYAVGEDELTPDELINVLTGLSVLNRLRANKAFDSFKATLKLDEYREKEQD